ncbi:hypothetical protein M9Y10_005744 [Tritrichomonas musculus]|uniref:BEACH domain-containing protein n=1 Tax=Tritrichomonas musculus TaxID=1915356 RepID=A0ABR2JF77_9EUKA
MDEFEIETFISADLISSIFILGSSINTIPNMTPEVNQFFQTVKLNRYSSNEIKQMQYKYNSLQSTQNKLLNLLNEYSFNFPYLPVLLESIQSIDRKSTSAYDFAAIVVLYSFIAWCYSIEKTKTMVSAKNLIKDLLFTRNTSHRNLIDKVFISTIQIFLKFCTEDDMYSIVDDFLTYIKYVDYPELVIHFLKRFWKFPTFLTNSRFFDFIEKLALTIETIGHSKIKNSNNPDRLPYFNDTQINTIVRTMSAFINKLEPSALDLLVAIGHPLPLETAKLIIPTFGKSLESLILLNKPLKFNDDNFSNNENNVISFTKFEGNDLQFDFPMIDSFPGGFNPSMNQVKIPEPLHINEVMDKNVISIAEKMAKLIANNPCYSSLYVDSFSDSLRIHLNTEYFASIYAIFLYSCDMIKQVFINNHSGERRSENDLVYKQINNKKEDDNCEYNYLYPTKVCLKFYNEKIFNPAITIYESHNLTSESVNLSLFSIINTFRHISLELMLSDDGTAVQDLLVDTICSYPLLLAELFQRLSDNVSIFYLRILRNPQIIDTLIRVAISYQRFEITATKETIEEVRKARISLFSLMSRLLSIQQVLLLFFQRRIPSMNFLAFGLEEQLTKFVFEFYKSFLILATPEEIEITTHSIFSIFTVIVSKFSVRKSKEILFKMLDSINDAMTNHPQINYLFADDCNVLFVALPLISSSNMRKNTSSALEGFDSIVKKTTTIENDETKPENNENKYISTVKRKSRRIHQRSNSVQISRVVPPSDIADNKELLQEMIRFFAQTASFYSISEEQVDLLITALLSFKDPDYVVASYNRFIQLLAGDCLPSLNPCFIIRQPQVLKLFIRVLIDSPKLTEILTFIYELCKFSLQNIKTCANSELNLILIDLLIRDKTEEKLSKETVELILDLLSILSIRHSSIRAVYKYISLMSMTTPTSVYRYEQLVIDTLNTIINESMNEPSSSFALIENNVISTNINITDPQIKQKILTEGFTFVFWLNIEESQLEYEANIFKLSFDDDIFCRISIQHQTLFMMVNDIECVSSDKLVDIPDMNVWHFISITFNLKDDESNVYAEVDIQKGSLFNKLFFQPLSLLSDPSKVSNIVLSIGGKIKNMDLNDANSNSSSVQFPSRIANCGLFPILTKDQQIELFEMGKRIANDTINFSSSDSVQPFKFFFEFKEQSSQTNGFLNVLTQQCGLSSLLPLFKLRSMRLNDGTLFNADFQTLLQFLSRVLCSSFECQKKFCNESGFTVLRILIIENWIDQFSYKTYLTLFSLLQSLKYEELRKQLFVEILANFSLLKKIESKQLQLRILKNWQQSLFDSCRNLAIQTGTFKQLLPAVIESFSDDEYEQHRYYFYKILSDCALSTELNIQFIEYIMNHAVACKKVEIKKEINDLLNLIVVETPRERFHFKFESESFMYFIEYFFHHSDDSLQILVLQIFINCYQKKLISGAYSSKIVFLIIESYSFNSKVTHKKSIFDFISDNLLKAPFFLSLFFFLAIQMDIKDMKSYLVKKSSSSFAFGSQWAVWPLLYCIKNPSQQENVLTFLINSCKNNYCQLFAQILFVFYNDTPLLEQITEKFISIFQAVTINNNFVSADFYEISEFIIMFKLQIVKVQKSLSRNDLAAKQQMLESKYQGIRPSYSNDSIEDDDDSANQSDNVVESSILSPSNYIYKTAMMNEVKICEIEKIASLPESIPYMDFQIKFMKDSGIWIHKTLAIQNIEIFHEQINTGKLTTVNSEDNIIDDNNNDDVNNLTNIKNRYIFFMLSLCAFLESSQYQDVQDFLKSLNMKENDLSENKIAVQLINYHRVRADKEPLEEFGKVTSPLLYESNYRTFIEKNRPARLENYIRDTFRRIELFIIHLRERIMKLKSTNYFLYFEEASKFANDFQLKFEQLENCGKNEWKRLWTVLSFDNAPWHMIGTKQTVTKYQHKNVSYEFKRSPVLNPFVPTKMTLLDQSIQQSSIDGKVLFTANNCFLITVENRIQISLIVQNDGVTIKSQFVSYCILNEWIEDVILRCPQQTASISDGFEIYTVFGVTFCIETGSLDVSNNFIESLNIKNKNSNLQMARYARLWMDCKLSNFDYILMVNKYSGRSFNDLSFYPVAPWLTYSSSFEDEESAKLERDLKKKFKKIDSNDQNNQNQPLVDRNDVLMYLSNVEPFKTLNHERPSSPNQDSEPNGESESIFANGSNESGSLLAGSADDSMTNGSLIAGSNEEVSLDSNRKGRRILVDSGSDDFDELSLFSKSSSSELIPEFFSFEQITKIGGIDFVYNHRQLLESPSVSASLHFWLSHAFPCMESRLSILQPQAGRSQKKPFHPHRQFFAPMNEIQFPITLETNVQSIAAACFTSSMTLELFTLNINTSIRTSASSSNASLNALNSSSQAQQDSQSSSQASQTYAIDDYVSNDAMNAYQYGGPSSYIQSLPLQIAKKKSAFDDRNNKKSNTQNGAVLTYKFTIHNKAADDIIGDFDEKAKAKYGRGFLPGILHSKQIKSDLSLSSHLKESNKHQKLKPSKNRQKNVRNNKNFEEPKSISFKRTKKNVRCPIFNNVSSIYNAAASCFIGPGSLQFQRSEFLSNYNSNLNKKLRNNGSTNAKDDLIDISNAAVQVIPSISGGFWAVLVDGIVYIIEFDDQFNQMKPPPIPHISSMPDTLRMNLEESQGNSVNNSNSSLTGNSSSDEFRLIISPNFTSASSSVTLLGTNKASFVCCSGLWVVVSVQSSSILEVFYNKRLVNKIETFEESFKFVSFNERKKSVACLARDSILICDVVCGCVSCVIPSMKNAKKAFISDEWGFVVVYVESNRKRKFLIFTLNGDFLREVFIDEKACFLKLVKTFKGDDFLIFTVESGQLFVMNLFEGEVQGPIFNIGMFRVADVFYNEEKLLLSVVTVAGTVSFVPLDIS